jgi:CRP/FNR family cyclic AMP-dependent transcriptional regulator
MKIKDLAEYKKIEVDGLMRRIPFFKELQEQAPGQLEVLVAYSCIVELEPGETIMRRGDRGSWLYFLIKGRLSVFLDAADEHSKPLNSITPGELFGDLALICNHERKATVAAERSEKKALLFATDFKPFGELLDFSKIGMETKLVFYRTMVNSIRWRLEVNRIDNPGHKLAIELRQTPVYNGDKGGEKELQALHDQAQFLASILDRWNSEIGNVEDIMVAERTDRPAS